MTDASEVKISDADKTFLIEEHAAAMCAGAESDFDAWVAAIKALIARRVPDAMDGRSFTDGHGIEWVEQGPELFNALRARVLNGE